MKLWIIYKNGIGFSKIIAELLQDRLEDYIDVSVGTAKKIDPALLVEEKFEFLMMGDTIIKEIPSSEIQNWLLKYWEISNETKNTLKAISGFCIVQTDISVEPLWIEFFNNKVRAELIFPSILRLRLNVEELSLENGAPELIKRYSNDFVEFIVNNKNTINS